MLANSRRSHNAGAFAGEGSDPSGPSLFSTQVLALGGLIAPVVFVGLSWLDSMIQPGYNLLTGYVSDLSRMSEGWMTVASFIITGWLLIGFSIALCRLADAGTAGAWSPVLIGFMGFGLIAAGAFEIDPSWSRLTLHGELHYASTAVGLFAASLVLPSAALPGLLERIALLIGAAWIAGFAQIAYPRRRLDHFRHEFERNGMAA